MSRAGVSIFAALSLIALAVAGTGCEGSGSASSDTGKLDVVAAEDF
jgi:hypothetical protein